MSQQSGNSAGSIGRALTQPVVVLAVFVLVINDHVLKRATPSWATGKLSDVAGMVFFPVLLFTGWELLRRLFKRPPPSTLAALLVCGVSAAGFALVKTLPWANEAYRWAIGALRWPAKATEPLLAGQSLPPIAPVEVLIDPTDLVAVAAAAGAFLMIRRAIRQACATGSDDRLGEESHS